MTKSNALEKHDHDLAEHVRHQSPFKAHLAGIGTALAAAIGCIIITSLTYFTFGVFKILFGILTGVMVKAIGKGSGVRFGIIAGGYAVLAAVAYEALLSLLFYDPRDPAFRADPLEDGLQQFEEAAYNLVDLIWQLGTAGFAFLIAYRIGKNPMKKDELDYLLEEKIKDTGEAKYDKNYFRRRARR